MNISIALTGFYGAGKYNVGRQIAIELGIPYSDMYEEMVKRSGMPVQQLYEQLGYVAYQQYENLALSGLAVVGGVVATTGGCVLSAYNRRILHEKFLTIFLDTPFEDMYEHIHVARYPNVGNMTRLELYKLYEYSRPVYEQTADHIITASCSPEILCDRILELVLTDN